METEASLYEGPFAFVHKNVFPERQKNKRAAYKTRWWIHVEARPAMRAKLKSLSRSLCTARVSKHRMFSWVKGPILPDSQVFAFAVEDDFTLGILHSRPHEVWARSLGTQVRERESGFRYTPTTCFETFAFPNATTIQFSVISEAARTLDALRTRWLNPPEWTREEILEFPGSVDGPWARYVHEPDERGIGTVRYPVLKPRTGPIGKELADRTLTNLYNKPPAWLEAAHRKLDAAVFDAYGWDPGIADEEILARLLVLNLERAGSAGSIPIAPEAEDLE